MSKYQFLALAGVVVCGAGAFFAVDSYTQSRNPGGGDAGFSLSAVTDFIDRLTPGSGADDCTAQAAAMLATYPAAPEGWTRRTWQAEDAALIDPPREMTEDEKEIRDAVAQTLTGRLVGQMSTAADQRRAAQTAIYQQGAQRIALHIEQVAGKEPGGITGMAMALARGNMTTERPSFALVHGVPYRIGRGAEAEDPATANRSYHAEIGDGIRITLHAEAEEAAVYDIIAGIDYDALNGMLDDPLPDVGAHVPTPPRDRQRELAAQMEAERVARLRAEGVAAGDGFKAFGGALKAGAPDKPADPEDASVATRIAGALPDGDAPAPQKSAEVRVNRAGSAGDSTVRRITAGGGGCQMIGAMKRCTVASD